MYTKRKKKERRKKEVTAKKSKPHSYKEQQW
jgi:hypothetical protein